MHAGTTLHSIKTNLLAHAKRVRELVHEDGIEPLPVGLWLANDAAVGMSSAEIHEFRDLLDGHRLKPYTFNGFPFADFHQDVVKHEVYEPTWASLQRSQYTQQLATILDGLLPTGEVGTISTLPIGWPTGPKDRGQSDLSKRFCSDDLVTLEQASNLLASNARQLVQMEAETGRLIRICIEPEPGCLLDCADDIRQFFEQSLLPASTAHQVTASQIRRHITVCHDVCHSAVMFEPQANAIAAYLEAGIQVGKVQVSSAVEARLGGANSNLVLEQLATFNEPKYLHQTSVQTSSMIGAEDSVDGRVLQGCQFFEDLPDALAGSEQRSLANDETWRVHFHVPIFMERLGELHTTQFEIVNCFRVLQESGCFAKNAIPPHVEVETYAWNVLPKAHAESSLADGIAKEIHWLVKLLQADL